MTEDNIKVQDEAYWCYLQDRNMFEDDLTICPHCKERIKIVDRLAIEFNRILGHDSTRRHSEVVKCIHPLYVTDME